MSSKQTSYGLQNQVIKQDKSVHQCPRSLVTTTISIKRWTNIPLNPTRTPFSPHPLRTAPLIVCTFVSRSIIRRKKQRNLINGCIMRLYERGTDMFTSPDSGPGNNHIKSQLPREAAVISRHGIKVQSFSEDDLCATVARALILFRGEI